MLLLAEIVFLVQLLELIGDEFLPCFEFFLMVEQFFAVTLIVEHYTSVVVYVFKFDFCRLYRSLAFLHHTCVSSTSMQFFMLLLLQQLQLLVSILLLQSYVRTYFSHPLFVLLYSFLLSFLVSLVFRRQLFLFVILYLCQFRIGNSSAYRHILQSCIQLLGLFLLFMLSLSRIVFHLQLYGLAFLWNDAQFGLMV